MSAGIRLGYKADGEPRTYRGDAHILTVAPTRAGKGTDLLVPALLTCEHSFLVVDPKGQLSAITSRRRQELGQEVLILNPFEIWCGRNGQRDYLSRFQHVGFNPLGGLLKSSELSTDCESVTEAIVLQEEGGGDKARFFTDGARQLVTGLMMYIIESPTIAPENKNLVTLYKMISGDVCQSAQEAMETSKNELIHSRLGRFAEDGAKERASVNDIVSTARGECNFIGSEALVRSLKGDSRKLRFKDLRRKPMTVYLILPTERLGPCAKWFRLVVEAALFDLMHDLESGGPGRKVVMLMDEFAQLKRLQIIEEALAGAAGYGVQLWPVLQDLTQLQELYDKRWETFIGNAGISTWYAPRENTTADYVSKMCGETEVGYDAKNFSMQPFAGSPELGMNVNTGWQRVKRPLLLPEEVCGRGTNKLLPDEMLIFAAGMNKVIRGKRRPYWNDPNFVGMFDPDPYPHAGEKAPEHNRQETPSGEGKKPGDFWAGDFPKIHETDAEFWERVNRQMAEDEKRRRRRWWPF